MKKLKVLFVNFPTISPKNVEACFKVKPSPYMAQVPLGIVHLGSVLEEKDYIKSVDCLDYCIELENGPTYGSYENFIETLAEKYDYEPDILAYSMNFSTQHDFFMRCEKILKMKWPKAICVAGGTHSTNITAELLEAHSLDYVVRGEAEDSFAQLLELVSSGRRKEALSIKGVYSKEFDFGKEPLKISEYPILENLPMPSWHLFDMSRYKRSMSEVFLYDSPKYSCSIMTSRGCPFHCTFCSSFSLHGRKMRYFGVEWVKRAVMGLYSKFEVSEFVIQDDMFTVHKERTVEMLSELQSLNIPRMGLSVKNALSVNTLNEPVVDALCKTGLETAYLAVESGSKHVNQNIMKKRVNLDTVPKVINMFRERDVPTVCFFILGFPGETKDMIFETIEFAKRINSDWCTFNAVKPLVGTPLYDEMLAEGYIDHTPDQWNQTAYGLREFDTKEISKEELNDLLYDANIKINFINNYNVKIGNYDKAIKMFQNIADQYPYHVVALYMLYKSFKGKKVFDESNDFMQKITNLLKTDQRAASMYNKYKRYLPDIDENEVFVLSGTGDFRSNSSTTVMQQLDENVEVEQV